MVKLLFRMHTKFALSCISCTLLFLICASSSFATTTFASAGPTHQTTNHASSVAITHCGGTCEGKDPYTYYNGVRCSDTAGSTPANAFGFFSSSNVKLLTIQNWYSKSCQTNWAVAYLQGNTNGVSIAIYREGSNNPWCYPDNCSQDYYGTASPLWTNMTVAPTVKTCIDSNAYSIQDRVWYVISGIACA